MGPSDCDPIHRFASGTIGLVQGQDQQALGSDGKVYNLSSHTPDLVFDVFRELLIVSP